MCIPSMFDSLQYVVVVRKGTDKVIGKLFESFLEEALERSKAVAQGEVHDITTLCDSVNSNNPFY